VSDFTQYVPPTGSASPPPPSRREGGTGLKAAALFFVVAALMFVAMTGFLAWRWADANLLHWGVEDGKTQELNHAELLQQIQAFELATVKQTYSGQAHVEAPKVLRAGPASWQLPGFVAGQELDANGKVIITAGVDLSKVRPEDMQVTRNGKDVHVTIRVPAPEILSTELVPNTLNMNASAGMITRVSQAAGLSEKDLHERAADQVTLIARDTALQQGILEIAARETEQRLQAFLQSLPATGSEKVTYSVVARQPSAQ
jgi:hypothetical protein